MNYIKLQPRLFSYQSYWSTSFNWYNLGQSTNKLILKKLPWIQIWKQQRIAHQIKLRDLSGLIVIDFIDMMNFYNRRIVEKNEERQKG